MTESLTEIISQYYYIKHIFSMINNINTAVLNDNNIIFNC